MATLKKLVSGARAITGEPPVEEVVIGIPGKPHEAIVHKGKIYIYNVEGQTLIDGGIIATKALLANSVTTEKLALSSKQFVPNITWTATDYNTCSWGSGNIKWADGETSSINAGNTGNIAAKTYIYYNNTTTLQKTTTYSTAVGANKILLAIVELSDDTDAKCLITPVFSTGATIDGDKIVTGKIESVDGKTYFDLNNNRFMLNDDDDDDRLLMGYQEDGFGTGIDHGIKISKETYDVKTALTKTNKKNFTILSTDATHKVSTQLIVAADVNVVHGLGFRPFWDAYILTDTLTRATPATGYWNKTWYISCDATYLYCDEISGTNSLFYIIYLDEP